MTNLENLQYFYQPIYNVEEKIFDKVELLLRIYDEDGTYQDTEEYIARAEKSGIIKEVDCRTFLQACKMLPKFQLFGVKQISVNLSPVTCNDSDIIVKIKEILRKTKVNPKKICLEITEMSASGSNDRMNDTIKELSNLGFSIAIDDFGKGYSGLTRMLEFPFNVLKLDKSLVDRVENQMMAISLIQNIICFAKYNGVSVTAEGVESVVSMQHLIRLKCNNLQGFHFSKPVPQELIFEKLGQLSKMSISNNVCSV